MYRFTLLFLNIFLLITGVFSQENSNQIVSYLTVRDGLASGNVKKITQDSQGFIWIATENGLTRFDGYENKTFVQGTESMHGINHSFVNEVVPQNDYGVFVGTISGLNVYNPENQSYKHYYFFSDDSVRYHETVDEIVPLPNGNCFIRTDNEIGLFNKELDTLYKLTIGEKTEDKPQRISLYNETSIIVANKKGELYTVNEIGDTNVLFLSEDVATEILKIGTQKFIIGTEDGTVYVFDNKMVVASYAFPFKDVSHSEKYITSIVQRDSASFYIGTQGAGVLGLTLNDGWNTDLLPQNLLINKNISNLFVDKDKNLWVGHQYGGVSIWLHQTNEISYLDCPQIIQRQKVQALQLEGNDLWIGTEGAGAFVYNMQTKKYTQFNKKTGFHGVEFDNIITSITALGELVIVSTYNKGLYVYNNKTGEVINNFESLATNSISKVFVDSKKRLWVGTYNEGVYCYDLNTFRLERKYSTGIDENAISCNAIIDFDEDGDGAIWVATYYGISKIEVNGNVKQYVTDEFPGLGNNIVKSIYYCTDSIMWFGTLNGISLYNSKNDSIISFNDYQQEFKATINAFFQFDTVHHVIITQQSIYLYDEQENTIGYIGACPFGEFSNNTYAISSDSIVLLGSEKGIVQYSLDTAFIKNKEFVIELTDLLVQGISIFSDESKYKAKFNNGQYSMKLPYFEDNVKFVFSDFDFNHGSGSEYVYKLEGFNNEWQTISGHNFVNYTNLPGGEYVFLVKKRTANGFSNSELRVNIKIAKAFWEVWFFYVIVFLILSVVLFLAYNARVSKIVVTRNKLQRQVELRMRDVQLKTQEIQAQKEKIIEQRDIANRQSAEFARQKESLIVEQDNLKSKLAQKQSELYEAIGEGNILRAHNEELESWLSLISYFSHEMICRVALPSEDFEFVSNGAKYVTGYDASEFYNDKHLFRHLVASENKDDFKKFRKYMSEGKIPPITEYQILTKEGKEKWVAQYSRPIKNDKDEVVAFEAMIVDIHELKTFKLKSKSAQKRLKDMTLVSDSQVDNAGAHTSFQAIKVFTDLLKDNGISLDEKLASMESTMNSTSTLQMIDDLIDINKIEDGELNLNNSQCYVNTLLTNLHESYSELKNKNKKKHISLKLNLPIEEQNFSFYTDTFRLRQIMINLIGNAFKYTKRGVIEFGYMLNDNPEINTGKEIIFFVKDTGAGIPASDMNSLFDGFHISKETGKVQGVGLSLSKKLCELLGGRMWVETNVGEGSVFSFAIPVEKMKGLKKTDKKKVDSFKLDWSKKTLLLAEDEEANFDYVNQALKKTNITILWARNGEEAFKMFSQKQRDIDVVLMDIQMPKMNGYEATQKIKEIDDEMPVIAQTAYANSEAKLNCFDAGCDNYLAKPYKTRDLIDVLSKYLS